MLALALGLGAVVVGQAVLVPLAAGNTSLVDPNLARALSEPLALRAGEIALAACVVLSIVAGPWLRHKAGTTLALLSAGVAALDRLVLLPSVHDAWGRVDLVAARPVAKIELAEQASQIHHGALAVLVLLMVATAAMATNLGRRSTS
jgi:hypothetical protein